MINKQLEHIIKEDLKRLIENSVSEGKSIDYKIKYSLTNDKEKGEFLADISSFANTSGGDLIFGIKEEDGIAKGIDGISLSNIDSEKLKIESLIRDGIEPRIQPDIHVVSIDNTKIVLIIRIHKSWLSPHRVIFKGHSKTKDQFYARNSAGKYQLDTGQLRTAFELSNSLVDKIKDFKTERTASLIANNTPVPFYSGGKIILHLIPLESFSYNVQFNINKMEKISNKLRPLLCPSGWNVRINLEGLIKYSGGINNEESLSYVQLYRNGIIEAVKRLSISSNKYLSTTYERELLDSLPEYLTALKNLNVSTPVIIFLTLTGVKGCGMAYDNSRLWDEHYPIDRDILILPEALVETYNVNPKDILRPVFDLIWNACGFRRSYNFDENDNWVGG